MNIFDNLREKLQKAKQKENARNLIANQIWMNAIRIVDEVEQEFDNPTLCCLGSPCEYQTENANINHGWIACTKALPPQPKPNPEFEGKSLELYLVSMNDSKYPWRAFWNGKDFTDGWRVVYPIAWQQLPKRYMINDLVD